MNPIKQLFDLHCEMIPIIESPIYVALTGGIDSRILAGLLTKFGYTIDLGAYFYTEDTKHNIPHIEKLLNNLIYRNFEFIKRDLPDIKFQKSLQTLNKKYDLSQYTNLCHIHGMQAMGSLFSATKKKRELWLHYFHDYNLRPHDGAAFFKEVIYPFWNGYYVAFCYSLPKWYRFKHYGHIKMLKEYFPELVNVPLCREDKKPMPLDWLVVRKLLNDIGVK